MSDISLIVYTPHNAYNTRAALLRILDKTIDNINGFINGQSINSVIRGG
ncbi:hypothetical protein GF327_05620 [Candidatus Woesearchaeota archaeon]|nr:hypothetical protein [Candidatus Woesearchaeota archaeon]